MDAAALAEPWQTYLRIVGDFKIEVRAASIYTEEQFPLVEFAIQSQIWSREAVLQPRDFNYTSLESEEPSLVWFRMEQGTWKIGSAFQDRDCAELFGLEEIVAALDRYYKELRRHVDERFHVDIAGLFDWSGVPRHDVGN